MLKVNDIVQHRDYPHFGIVRRVVEQGISIYDGRYECFADVVYNYPHGGGMTLCADAHDFKYMGNIDELVSLENLEEECIDY